MISTHVLDTTRGSPAAGVPVTLEQLDESSSEVSRVVAEAVTDADGRVRELVPPAASLGLGQYRLRFDTGAYFRAQGVAAFYPEVTVVFVITDATQLYHVPLLLYPFGYSTYRGS
jgi:5-hydroxyisourate hydrolase